MAHNLSSEDEAAQKKGRLDFSKRPLPARVTSPTAARRSGSGLEGQRRLQLDDSRRSIATQERSQNAGGRRNGGLNGSEGSPVLQIVERLIEVRVIEQIEHLERNSEVGPFPTWDRCVLSNAEVHVRVPWTAVVVPQTIRPQMRSRIRECQSYPGLRSHTGLPA